MRSLTRNIKAVSPVIATIIIVAIAITMSIAVAYWMLGLGSSFTRYEKIEFTNAYVIGTEGNYTIFIEVKNTGSASATIAPASTIYNGKPQGFYGNASFIWTPNEMVPLEPGESGSLQVNMLAVDEMRSGMTLEVTVRTTAGKEYPKVIVMP